MVKFEEWLKTAPHHFEISRARCRLMLQERDNLRDQLKAEKRRYDELRESSQELSKACRELLERKKHG